MTMLLCLFLFPLVFAALSTVVRFNKVVAFIFSLIPLAILLIGVESDVFYPWFKPLSINFHLHVDAISKVFLYLTALVIPFSILAVKRESRLFYPLVFALQGLLIGFFTARDLVLFTLFWEAIILPLFFIINIWGGEGRKSTAMKFLLYMIAGSALLVAAVLSVYLTKGTFDMDQLIQTVPAPWVAFIFFLAFAVKTPLFPFHAWLPDAYYEASTAGSILLAAILSKAGIYGFIRVGLELFPTYLAAWGPILLTLAIIGVFWGALVAWRQGDYKRLIAYSSFSHINFILAGLFVFYRTAEVGSVLQAFNHGITITALFLVAGWLERRLGSTSMAAGSGMAKYLPNLCWLTLFFVLSSIALPGMNNFIGELLILFGVFNLNKWLAAFLGLTVILSVVYMLRWMQRVYFEPATPFRPSYLDLNRKELLIALPLIALILWVGFYPSPLLQQIEPYGYFSQR